MTQLDARLVSALGLSGAASEFVKGARAAGLKVPARFGTEVVARLLGLRLNHPAAEDGLELLPNDPATRAEAAYSAAQILGFGLAGGTEVMAVQALADSFALPQLSTWQTRILDVAVSKIGMPYVWGGTSDGPEAPFGVQSRGGYDCSGFVWRVYKLQSYPGEGDLASVIRGRTTFVMSVRGAEVGAHRLRRPPARRRPVLRRRGAPLPVGPGGSHGDLPREQLVHPVLRRGRRGHDADRLVQTHVRLGEAASGRSRAHRLIPSRDGLWKTHDHPFG